MSWKRDGQNCKWEEELRPSRQHYCWERQEYSDLRRLAVTWTQPTLGWKSYKIIIITIVIIIIIIIMRTGLYKIIIVILNIVFYRFWHEFLFTMLMFCRKGLSVYTSYLSFVFFFLFFFVHTFLREGAGKSILVRVEESCLDQSFNISKLIFVNKAKGKKDN